jgi:hypothetical protein
VIRKLKQLGSSEGDLIIITYIGILESADLASRTSVTRDGKPFGIGYGAQNLAPAKLTIKKMVDASVIRK